MTSAPGPGRALVSGATSLIGSFLLPRLAEAGFEVVAVSRRGRPPQAPPSLEWKTADLGRDPRSVAAGPVPLLFHLAPLWLLPQLLPELAAHGLRRVVAFGSTSRFTKEASPTAAERRTAALLAGAEEQVAAACARHGLRWTVLRPTLIYGAPGEGSLGTVARLARRFGVFPLAGEARGCRQPVHADDLAAACLAVVRSPATLDRAYDVAGATRLPYREMVEAVIRATGRRPRLVRLPAPALRVLLRAASLLPALRHLDAGMADRMDRDQCFDCEEARRDFGYAPRPFDAAAAVTAAGR